MTTPPRIETVSIALGETSIDITVGMKQCCAIGAAFGGMIPAHQAVTAWDAAACALIVSLGSGKPVAEIGPLVFESGLNDLVPALDRYLNLITNGGRDPAVAEA